MKVIFLDINGVLDTYEEMDIVNPSNLQRLRQVVLETGSKVVISSSLKNSYYYLGGKFCKTLDYFINEMEKVGIEIIGITPQGKNREEEISMYLEMHPEIENFCIIDDDYDMDKFSGHIVKLISQNNTSSTGLDDIHMNMAIDILKGEYMEKLEDKYIDLILNRCLNFEQSKSLMIQCDFKEHVRFAEKVKKKANEMGIFDVCINVNDLDEIHDYLKNTAVEDIKVNPLIDRSAWNEYALKGGALLFLNSNVPGLMDDIEEEKIKKWLDEREKTTRYYRANVSRYEFPWCIIALPNERWAKTVFGDIEDAYDKLYLNIMKMCMVNRENPVYEWEQYIKKNNYYKKVLNELGIQKMHYRNSLGTDLTVEIPEGNEWINLDKTDAKGGQMIANMPSYEIFTTPDYRKTNGIVYSSRPLIYDGCKIDEFSLTFKNGEVISCDARIGKNILEKLIFENENTQYLGEVALVPYDSPISNTGLVYNLTLFDENASCHLALGCGFSKSFNGYENMTNEELHEKGMNLSDVHEDFMIGTSDLEIEAETKNGKVLIFKNGNFNI